MKEGKVKFFNESKGYGFIKDAESSEEYFVHVSGLVDEIREEDDVSFELQQGKKGLNAVNVKLL
jgi:CspA family cold shock protein